jgi:hypothetical protein
VKKDASIEGLAQKSGREAGFFASNLPEEARSIFGDDRNRRISVEFVAEAGLNLVFLQAAVGIEKRTGRQQCA